MVANLFLGPLPRRSKKQPFFIHMCVFEALLKEGKDAQILRCTTGKEVIAVIEPATDQGTGEHGSSFSS